MKLYTTPVKLTHLNCEGTIFTQHLLRANSCSASSAFLNNLQNTRNAQTRTADEDLPSYKVNPVSEHTHT